MQFFEEFDDEVAELPRAIRVQIYALAEALEECGPHLGRPDAAGGVWGILFAFDPERKAILLVADDRSGVAQQKFYRRLIRKADDRFGIHVASLK